MEYENQGLMQESMGGSPNYKVILFDLGGVLLKLRDPISTFGLQIDEGEFLRNWIMSPSMRAFESGQIDGNEFAQRMITEMNFPMGWQELLNRFNDWPDGFYPKAIELVGCIPSRYKCAVLSNTNALHWQRADAPGNFGNRFDRCFLSYESGLLKPDQASYLQVIESYACRPEEILFFDDHPVNVEAAGTEGITSVRVQGPDELEAGLIAASVI
jgi:putative hydrolase of the HAD superfamily